MASLLDRLALAAQIAELLGRLDQLKPGETATIPATVLRVKRRRWRVGPTEALREE